MAKPTKDASWSGTLSTEPTLLQKQTGYAAYERPPPAWENWWWNAISLWVLWVKNSFFEGGTSPIESAEWFGNGYDGDVTVTTVLAALTRDMYYNSLTISGSGSIPSQGWRIFVKGTLDLTTAGANAIHCNGNVGITASSTSGAAAPASVSSTAILPNGLVGTAGGAGGAAAGTSGSTPGTDAGIVFGGASTTSGSGGTGASGAGGSGAGNGYSSSVSATTANGFPHHLAAFPCGTRTDLQSGQGGGGGGGGGGGSSGNGGGAGSGGSGGGVVVVFAALIVRGTGTAIGCLSANGGVGGDGFGFVPPVASGGRGGGGGGSGGGGGAIYLVAGSLSGATTANALRANGGNGGAGGNGDTNAAGGAGGAGAMSGQIVFLNLEAVTITAPTKWVTFTSGGAASGATGGAGATGSTTQADL